MELEFFKKAILKNRLSHLYLISGKNKIDQLNFVKDITYLILTDGKENNEVIYNQIQNNFNPNLILIETSGQTIKKEQILSLQEEFSKTNIIDSPRVYIISEIEKITNSAANSLLKFLEEPNGSKTYGFLLTSNKDKVLPTIISRSQVFNLKSLELVDNIKYFENNEIYIFDSILLSLLTTNLKEAKNILNQTYYLEIKKALDTFVDSLANNKKLILEMENKTNEILTTQQYILNFVNILLFLIEDIIFYKNKIPIRLTEYETLIPKIATRFSEEDLFKIFKYTQKLNGRTNYNVNYDLLFTTYYIKIDRLGGKND